MEKSIVSSAKNLMLDLMSVSRSLIYIRNNSGPRTDPWGTPDSIVKKSEHERLRTTRCFLLHK